MKLFVVAAVLAAAGCYSPQFADCELACAQRTCPEGLSCSDGMCRLPGHTAPCTTLPLIDAPVVDTTTPVDAWAFGAADRVTNAAGVLDTDPSVTDDKLEIYFNRNRDIWHVVRQAVGQPWGAPFAETSLNSNQEEEGPEISGDELTLWFIRDGASNHDINLATRQAGSVWPAGTNITQLDPGGNSAAPSVTRDGLMIVFERLDEVSSLWFSTRPNPATQQWEPPLPLTEFPDGPRRAHSPMITADKLTLYFHVRDGGQSDLYEAHRASVAQPFGVPTPLEGVNTAADEEDPWVSPDGRDLYFSSNRVGAMSIWHAQR